MLRIIAVNLNGMRSACSKDLSTVLLLQWLDVVCLEEVEAHESDVTSAMNYPEVMPDGQAGLKSRLRCRRRSSHHAMTGSAKNPASAMMMIR